MEIMIITGFLGSGKTAAILAVVDRVIESTGKKVVVIKNDFGRIGIDARVMKNGGLTVQEMHGGRICCMSEEAFLKTLTDVARDIGPDMVVVEPTGLEDPMSILAALKAFDETPLDSVRTVVVLDAVRFARILRAFPRPVERELRAADLVLVNKIDEVDNIELVDVLACLFDLGINVPIVSASMATGTNVERVIQQLVST